MRKRFMKLSVLLLVTTLVGSGFSSKKEIKSSSIFTKDNVEAFYYVPNADEVNMNFPQEFTLEGKSFEDFRNVVGFSESSNNYRAVNRLGYIGRYQFGWSALKWVGVKSKTQFLRNPKLQDKAFEALLSKNKFVLRDYIAEYAGKSIGGVKVTESGILAAAHLGGAGNVKKFLCSNGKDVFKDANNVPITTYMEKFAGYDLSSIPTDANALATL